jgi:hypothetical protein
MAVDSSFYVWILVGLGLVVLTSLPLFRSSKASESYRTAYLNGRGANKYLTKCGECVPLDEDQMTYVQQCTTYNSDGSPLDYYTETNVCKKCTQLPNRVLSCQSFAPKTSKYMGTTTSQTPCRSCLG